MSSDPLTFTRTTERNGLLRRDVALAALAVVVSLVSHIDASLSLAHRWLVLDHSYSHGFVVFALSLWMIGRELQRERFVPRPSLVGLLLALGASVGITLAGMIHVELLQYLGLVALMWSLTLAFLGWRAALKLAFPIGFILFGVTFWDLFAYPLQRVTAEVNGILLSLWDIRFQLNDTYISLDDIGIIEVASGCSGQRYLVISLALAGLFSYLNLERPRHWAMLAAVAVFLALVTNWIRVFVIILVAYETVMTSAFVHQHDLFGWILFVLLLVPLGWLGNRLIAREERSPSAAPDGSRSGRPPTSKTRVRRSGGTRFLIGIAAVLCVALPPAYAFVAGQAPIEEVGALRMPSRVGEWQQGPMAGGMWHAQWHGADRMLLGSYDAPGGAGAVTVGIWYYASQEQGKELIYYSNQLYDPQQWRAESRGDAGLPATDVMTSRRGRDSVALAHGFYIGGYWTANPLAAKLLQIPAVLAGHGGAALVTVSTRCDADCADALERVRAFSNALRSATNDGGLEQLLIPRAAMDANG